MTRDDCVLLVDAGTTAVKVAVVDTCGNVLAAGDAELALQRPGRSRVEQDPDQWWAAFVAAVRGCQLDEFRPAALALTGQMQDVVLIDQDSRPIRPAMLYADHRAAAQLDALTARLGERWYQVTGNVPDPSCTAAQLRWLAEHEPRALQRADRLLFGAPGYLVYRAGGSACCDLTTASTTGLLDTATLDWWAPAVAETGCPDSLLPELVDGASVVGRLAAAPAAELGLAPGLPLVHAPGDAGAVTAGLVGDDPGALSISLGTSGWVAAFVERVENDAPDRSIHRLTGPSGHTVLCIGALLAAGATLDWARTTHLPGLDHESADRAAGELEPTGLLMLPSLAGERSPVRNPDALGAIVGLRPTTSSAQLYRAAIEGVALSLRHIVDRLRRMTALGSDTDLVPLSGGAARSASVQRILADVLDRPILPVDAEGAGLRGAHRAVATALNQPVPPPLRDRADQGRVVRPGPHRARYAELAQAHGALWDALAPTFTALRPARSGADDGQAGW